MDAIATALLAASTEMPTLAKAARNQHSDYSYVPIDDFYRVVPQIARKYGLTWRIRETAWSHAEIGKHGAIAFTYHFDVIHVSGTILVDYASFTIVHPVQGAQTSGSAASYAEKLFMRTTFKLVTGEPDADSTDSGAFTSNWTPPITGSPGPELTLVDEPSDDPMVELTAEEYELVGSHSNELQQPVVDVQKLSDGDVEKLQVVEKLFQAWVPECQDITGLYKFHEDNLVALEFVQSVDPIMRQRIRDLFNQRRDQLKGA